MKSERPQSSDRAKRRLAVDPAARAWFMIFILVICVGLMIYVDFNRRLWNAPPEEPVAGRHWGNPDAELKIIQFLDFESAETIRGQQVIGKYIQKHPMQVSLQTRYFPQDDKSMLITTYAECANQQKKFRDFMTRLFEHYFQWSGSLSVTPILKSIASDAGLDMEELKVCVTSPQTTATITVDRVYGESLFVRTTPSYFLNGQSAVGVDELEKALEAWDDTLTQNE